MTTEHNVARAEAKAGFAEPKRTVTLVLGPSCYITEHIPAGVDRAGRCTGTHITHLSEVDEPAHLHITGKARQRIIARVKMRAIRARRDTFYRSIVAWRGGSEDCGLCGAEIGRISKNGKVNRMHIDHDHVTGMVRDLLCHLCNCGIGFLGDNPARLRLAAAYIERHRANPSGILFGEQMVQSPMGRTEPLDPNGATSRPVLEACGVDSIVGSGEVDVAAVTEDQPSVTHGGSVAA